ncbi:hypothetical protein ONS95_013286 [Cadophora gregata]|uniref:uncharacterized protein n=1 Tax=Cadophora gregata TaxID=51156 RepID=UPI0026DC152A|nr:uncharacterized protein ONS95_013286 [Cadophora gregata]KAK0099890.1 hypothetical protein ONS96_007839 [Cadophora gregata f. sp. sojae]KAK0116260.1 hypothetical protein ONS95_013286 [Cadophora gregata]
MATQTEPRLYFAYGSNLSLTQMARRCPSSTYHSLAVLRGWKWVIGPRGYANVVKGSSESKSSNKTLGEGQGDEVYGLLYVLDQVDEDALDVAEGVPDCYVKMMLGVEILGDGRGVDGKGSGEGGAGNTEVEVLIYVDVVRTGVGVCKEEYVARMNRGIKDAVERGMPWTYVKDVLRKWVREEDVPRDGDVKDPFFPGGT